jgi:hypothetical protein
MCDVDFRLQILDVAFPQALTGTKGIKRIARPAPEKLFGYQKTIL